MSTGHTENLHVRILPENYRNDRFLIILYSTAKQKHKKFWMMQLLRKLKSFFWSEKSQKLDKFALLLPIVGPHTIAPGWSPRDNQRHLALFQEFDVFQGWFGEYEKHQSWSTLFQSSSALILSDSTLIRNEIFGAIFRENQLWNSAV